MKQIFLALFSAALLAALPAALIPSAEAKLSNEQCALTNTGDRYSPEWQDMLLSLQSSSPPDAKSKRRRPVRKSKKGGSQGQE